MSTESLERVKEKIEARISKEKIAVRELDDILWATKNRILGLEFALEDIDKELKS